MHRLASLSKLLMNCLKSSFNWSMNCLTIHWLMNCLISSTYWLTNYQVHSTGWWIVWKVHPTSWWTVWQIVCQVHPTDWWIVWKVHPTGWWIVWKVHPTDDELFVWLVVPVFNFTSTEGWNLQRLSSGSSTITWQWQQGERNFPSFFLLLIYTANTILFPY